MLLSSRALRLIPIAASTAVCVVLLAACGSSSKSTTATGSTSSTSAASSVSSGGTAASAVPSATTTPATTASATSLPGSCAAIPTSLIATYTGPVGTTKALAAKAPSISCEFANASATSIVIVNIGKGTASEFATLRSISGQGGRTVTSLNGMGGTAFSISKGGVTRGVAVYSPAKGLYSVTANLTLAQLEALTRQLMQLS